MASINNNVLKMDLTNGSSISVDITSDANIYYYDEDDGFVKADIKKISKNQGVEVFSTTTTHQNKGEYDIVVVWDR